MLISDCCDSNLFLCCQLTKHVYRNNFLLKSSDKKLLRHAGLMKCALLLYNEVSEKHFDLLTTP
jgi:hypothetical protein